MTTPVRLAVGPDARWHADLGVTQTTVSRGTLSLTACGKSFKGAVVDLRRPVDCAACLNRIEWLRKRAASKGQKLSSSSL